MSPTARELREKRAALRASLARKRAAARAALDKKMPGRAEAARKKKQKRRNRIILLLLLLLLAMLQNCTCVPAPNPQKSAMHPGPGTPGPPSTPKQTWGGRIARQARPAFTPPAQDPLAWIDRFRMQVAARSPRLAACFVGAAQPGTLEWSAAVAPYEGTVSAHRLETTLGSDPLTREQQACVLGVLSAPSYRLDVEDSAATPSRVSMVIEF